MSQTEEHTINISACMIVKNEEDMLERCLNSIKHLVDEIIMVDTASTDRTVEVARSFGATIFHHPWQGDFSRHRNQSMGYAKGNWVLIIDADEELALSKNITSKENLENRLLNAPENLNCFFITVADMDSNGDIINSSKSPRIFRNGVGAEYRGIVHNKLYCNGKTAKLDLTLHHYGYALLSERRAARYQTTISLLQKRAAQYSADSDVAALFHLCGLHYQLNEYQAAVEYGNRCITQLALQEKSDSQVDLSFYRSVYHLVTQAHITLGEYDTALTRARQGIDIMPDNLNLLYDIACIGYFTASPDLTIEGGEGFHAHMEAAEKGSDPAADPFLLFPVSTSKEAIDNVDYWLMTAYIMDNRLEGFHGIWNRIKNEIAAQTVLHHELLCTLEKKNTWEYLKEVSLFLFREMETREWEDNTMDGPQKIMELAILFFRSSDSMDDLENPVTKLLNITSDFKDITPETRIFIAEFLLGKNMAEFFLNITATLLEAYLQNQLDNVKDSTKIAYTYNLMAQKQERTRKGILAAISCLNIAWTLTEDSQYRDSLERLKTQFRDPSLSMPDFTPESTLSVEKSEGRVTISIDRARGEESLFQEQTRDVFLRQIPPEQWQSKTGMNICIISDFNIAGGLTGLMRGINKYSEHKARCIIWHGDHFSYDKDIILDECGNDYDEAVEIVKNADFFHFGRYIFNFPGIDFNNFVTAKNCVVAYYGTYLRTNGPRCNEWHKKTGIAALTANDFTIASLLDRSYYHVHHYYFSKYGDMDEDDIPCTQYPDGTVKIVAGSGGSSLKGYDFLISTVEKLQHRGVPVEVEIISGVSNDECLRRKQKCHITFTSLHGGWGLSGVESMFLGHPVMCCLDPFVLSLYPDNPTVIVDRENLEKQIIDLVENRDKLVKIGRQSRAFAFRHFRIKNIIKSCLYTYDLIMNHERYQQGNSKPSRIYTF